VVDWGKETAADRARDKVSEAAMDARELVSDAASDVVDSVEREEKAE
jgi:hypothetical protein